MKYRLRGQKAEDVRNTCESQARSAPRGPVRWLIVVGVVLVTAIAVGTAMTVDNFRQRALDHSKRELENTALLLTRHFDQQFQDLQQVQKSLIAHLWQNGIIAPENFARRMASQDAHLMLKAQLKDDVAGDLTVLDADGNLINWSGAWPAPAINLADRDYFIQLKNVLGVDDEVVRPVLSRMTGGWKTLFARKLEGPNGEFLGVVTRGIEPDHFEKFFASVMLGDKAAIAIFHRDGTLMARYPSAGNATGGKVNGGALMQHLRFSDEPATKRMISPVDGIDRLGTIRLLRDFPIALVVTATVDGVLADWRSQTRFLVGVAVLSALIIAGLLYLVIRHMLHQGRAAQSELTLEKNRLGTAIDNMTQGLLLFDAQARVVICNQRYIDMYGLSRAVIAPGRPFRDVIAHRKETGTFEGDVDAYVYSVMRDVGRSTTQMIHTADGRTIQISSRPVADGGWVATHEDVTQRRITEEKIAHLAHYDALTDLPNRTLFRGQLEHELERLEDGAQCAVLYIDIDEFKGINDSLGHPVGDELLKMIAVRLRGCVRDSDVVARLGGDEFAIVQTAVESHGDVTDLVARIYKAIREPFECLGHRLLTDASIGIALAPRDGSDLDTLLKNADLAMYSAKADGRRTFRFFEPEMNDKIQARRSLELDLRHAIDGGRFKAGGFEVYYQPLLSLHDDTITGCEALLRWRHPERGMISPAEFIPVAEEIGVINQLGEWVLNTACKEAASWPGDIGVAVNVSPVQFRSHTLALKVAAALAASGLPARRLELEITEAVLIRDDEVALAILHRLRSLGVRIALDDFGTGYSSLSYLQRFPFDKIKIDRCFVADLAEPNGSSCIVNAVVNIAASRHMTTTAEGVETEAQKDLLRTLGCNEMQGWLFSAARPAAEVRALMETHKAKRAAA
ncbi:MAG: diguanylate cyclase [Tardiphaga sp.]|uniref:bifunctional diguanylate cyclase/phosphodiesterase n=1 Tax=Tardiphaga sp. TaxID=1926292 RepID=UPI0026343FFF|nr:EAL domain-containing protein [Tardiphaga sp.]MDB5500975.1 diguanylate cyclase [Tardiphaga sp.]